MPSYLVESYVPNASVDEARARARLAAELAKEVRYVRTTFLLGDETLFHLFEAPSVEAVRRAGQRAALQYERIVEVIEGSANNEEEETR